MRPRRVTTAGLRAEQIPETAHCWDTLEFQFSQSGDNAAHLGHTGFQWNPKTQYSLKKDDAIETSYTVSSTMSK